MIASHVERFRARKPHATQEEADAYAKRTFKDEGLQYEFVKNWFDATVKQTNQGSHIDTPEPKRFDV